jgi:hypothetical protein
MRGYNTRHEFNTLDALFEGIGVSPRSFIFRAKGNIVRRSVPAALNCGGRQPQGRPPMDNTSERNTSSIYPIYYHILIRFPYLKSMGERRG